LVALSNWCLSFTVIILTII